MYLSYFLTTFVINNIFIFLFALPWKLNLNHVFAPWFFASVDCNPWNHCLHLHFLHNVDSKYLHLQQVVHPVLSKDPNKLSNGNLHKFINLCLFLVLSDQWTLWQIKSLAMYQNLRCKVDSLLGSGGERAGRENKMGTEEKCLHEYNLTLTFEETMGRWVLY